MNVNAQEFGLQETKAKELTSGLKTILEEREILAKSYKETIELEINAENIPVFRELRLKIRDNRTKGINVWHKTNKEFFLAGGRFVDAIKNKEIAENERMEEKLMEGEKHFENLEKEKLAKLNEARLEKLAPYVEDTTGLDLSGMEEDVWDAYFSTKKAKFEAALAEEKRLEEERIENERLDKLESDRKYEILPLLQFDKSPKNLREISEADYQVYYDDLKAAKKAHDKKQAEIQAENDRLKKEQEIKDKKIEAERKAAKEAEEKRIAAEKKEREEKEAAQAKKDAAIQAELKKEREAAEKLRKEKLDAEVAELKRIEAEELEAEKRAKAPVQEKLNLWVDSFELPATDVDNETTKEILQKFEGFKKWAQSQVKNL